jgi:hypothetical protein
MLSSGISSHPLGCRHGLAVLLSLLACGCFTDPKIDPTQTRHCKDDKSCPWGSICGTNGICCESADGKTCKVPPPSGGLDATAIDTNTGYDVGYDISMRETGTGGAPGLDGSIDTGTDLPIPGPEAGTGGIPGTGGMPGTGGTGVIDAPGLDTVDAPLTEAGGIPGTGGAVGTGGTKGSGGGGGFTGGAPGSGGAVGTGGITGTGGASTCQPKARDCTSSLDNDCNGTPDNQETTYCTCIVGNSQACQEHPGYDGKGICKAGSQGCAASSDKTTSSWGACSGSIGPGTRNCTSSVDNDCNGTPDSQETTYCQCTAGSSQSCLPAGMCTAGSHTCAASSDNTTTGWGPCTGYTGTTTMYRDADGDGYGNPSQPAQVCAGTSGYVSNADDCDDTNANFKPGTSICSTAMQKETCVSGGGGTPVPQSCDQGCINATCRSDGTIGVPGYVSCTNSSHCSVAVGCQMDDPTGGCGTGNGGSSVYIYCDGPNDCPGQVCVFLTSRALNQASCYATQPPDTGDAQYIQVCDPLASTCQPPLACTKQGRYPLYACQ